MEDDDGSDIIPTKADSPLLRAERELRRLQQSMGRGEFVPRLQSKKYTSTESLGPVEGDMTIIDALTSPTRASINGGAVDGGPRESVQRGKKGSGKLDKATKGRQAATATNATASPTRFDVGVSRTGPRSPPSHISLSKRVDKRQTSKDRGENAGPASRTGSSKDSLPVGCRCALTVTFQ